MGGGLQLGVTGIRRTRCIQNSEPEPGVKIHNIITRLEYKVDNGDFLKVKARMCVRGDQQKAGVSFKETDLYAPVLKAAEARLLLALAAANGDQVIKTDSKQAYLYGDMGDDVVYVTTPRLVARTCSRGIRPAPT